MSLDDIFLKTVHGLSRILLLDLTQTLPPPHSPSLMSHFGRTRLCTRCAQDVHTELLDIGECKEGCALLWL